MESSFTLGVWKFMVVRWTTTSVFLVVRQLFWLSRAHGQPKFRTLSVWISNGIAHCCWVKHLASSPKNKCFDILFLPCFAILHHIETTVLANGFHNFWTKYFVSNPFSPLPPSLSSLWLSSSDLWPPFTMTAAICLMISPQTWSGCSARRYMAVTAWTLNGTQWVWLESSIPV